MVNYFHYYIYGTVFGALIANNREKASGSRVKGVEYSDVCINYLFLLFFDTDNISGYSSLYTTSYGQ